jgi:hypothetical protein
VQSHAIDGRRGIHGTEQDDDLGFYPVMVDIKGRIWQRRLREGERKSVRVRYGEALMLGWNFPMRGFQHQWLCCKHSREFAWLEFIIGVRVTVARPADPAIFARTDFELLYCIPPQNSTTCTLTSLQPSETVLYLLRQRHDDRALQASL